MKKTAAIVFGIIFATIIYGVGLVAPLTPSEGVPILWELLVFVIVPCAVLVACAFSVNSRPVKALLVIQAFLFVGFSIWLLYLQSSSI
jgi:hypothetical protein